MPSLVPLLPRDASLRDWPASLKDGDAGLPEADLKLIPRPPRPGLYAVTGQDIIPRALRALAVTFAPEHRIVWIDAANQFNAHWVAHSARVFHKDSREVLRSFKYARPFTAFQLETMVNQKLLPAARESHALFAVIAHPLWLYEEAEDQKYATQHSFALFTEGLQRLSRELAILLLIPPEKETLYFRKLLKISHIRYERSAIRYGGS